MKLGEEVFDEAVFRCIGISNKLIMLRKDNYMDIALLSTKALFTQLAVKSPQARCKMREEKLLNCNLNVLSALSPLLAVPSPLIRLSNEVQTGESSAFFRRQDSSNLRMECRP